MNTGRLGVLLGALLLALAAPALTDGSGAAASEEKTVIAILGTGRVGGALGPRLAAIGFEVVFGSRDPTAERVVELVARTGADARATSQAEAAAAADWVLFAVPYNALDGVLDTVARSADTTGLPDAEIWSYLSNDRLRVTSAEGPPAVDPLQVAVPDDWEELPAFREMTLGMLERKLGLPDLRQRIRIERSYTPIDWAADMNLYRGATFSLAHSLDQMLSFRPRNRFEDLDGVYLTGGGTHPGSGLPVKPMLTAMPLPS